MQHLMKKFVQSSYRDDDPAPPRPPGSDPGTPAAPRAPAPSPPASSSTKRPVATGEVATAVEGFQYAMLLAERKTALATLQNLWDSAAISDADHELLIPVLLHALGTDPRDTELMEAMLELMQAAMTMRPANATFLLRQKAALGEILGLMQDPSPWIRGPTVQLIKAIQDGDVGGFATHVLDCHEGLRLLLDVVEDKREHIRDTAVQILLHLITHQSPMAQRHIQQFLAFEDGFARLFQIVDLELEGHGVDSAVLVDCLQVLYYMVHDNANSQYLLTQTPFVPALFPLLLTATLEDGAPDATDASAPPTPALLWALKLLGALIGPLYADATELDEVAVREQSKRAVEIPALQSYLAQQPDVVPAVAELATFGAPADRVAALELLRAFAADHEANQLLLLTLPVRDRAYFLTPVLRLDVHHEETPLSHAATRLLDSIWPSPLVKISLLQHIPAPPPHESGPITPVGQDLVDVLQATLDALLDESTTATLALTARDATKVAWKAMTRWRQLVDSAEGRELALRVPLETQAVAVPGGLFLTQWLRWTVRACAAPVPPNRHPLCVGLFRVLVASLRQCPKAVAEVTTSVPTLTFLFELVRTATLTGAELERAGLAAAVLGLALDALPTAPATGVTKQQFLQMLTERAGLQRLTDCFTRLQQTDALSSTRRPDGFAFPVYDKAFGTLFKHTAEKTRTAILSAYMGQTTDEDSTARAYQDLIRLQDAQLTELRQQLAARTPASPRAPTPTAPSAELQAALDQVEELRRLQEASDTRFRGLRHAFDHVEAELAAREEELARLRGAPPAQSPAPTVPSEAEQAVAEEEHSVRQLQLESALARLRQQLATKDEELAAQQATIDRLAAHRAVVDAQQLEAPAVAKLRAELEALAQTHAETVATLVARHDAHVKQLHADWELRLQEVGATTGLS
ncbi:hypothetical protein ACHHYP_06911 [Achlya hypogyna]|uniref:Vesicle tethering protein Uso1/P115-like head domain-containing protein n=1 Tax=Achlya hypogyna TaxID=1202772 RepID=A0A1V9ZN54_ACHHY|nr:hypothetical protein ACHHYP_06911 [Achlya hypogyna]